MRGLTVTDQLLAPIVAADPAAPLFTWYDDATDARMGLSGVTLANWAAKCANLLRDQYDVGAGDEVGVLLPAHWQTAGILFGAWWAGGRVRFGESGRITFCAPDRIAEADGDEILAVGLDAFGLAVRDLPVGIDDYTTEVRAHPDAFTPAPSGSGSGLVLADDTVDVVVARSTALAASAGYTRGDRVLSTREWRGPEDVYDGLLAPLAAQASVIQVSHPDRTRLTAKFETEKATARLA